MGKRKVFELVCPCCRARLRVAPDVRAVLSHEPPPKHEVVTDLAQAVHTLREKESRREQQFRRSVEAQRERARILERKFEEAFKKAKQEPADLPPKRDFDLE